VRRHGLDVFERAAGFQIGGDPGRAESVTTDLDLHAELGRAALDHAVSVDPMHGLAVQLTGAADGAAEEGARKASNL
jgi:hypothetical protein